MIISDILSLMEVLDNELAVDVTGDDEQLALVALDTTQDYFETLASTFAHIKSRPGILTTTANTETTTYPSTLLRLDALWYLDITVIPNLPVYPLSQLSETGGHIPALPWPYQSAYRPGAPAGFWDNEIDFYWRPIPNAVHSLRYYGFVGAAQITDRNDVFAYPDHLRLPFASFAAKLMAMGVGDNGNELTSLAVKTFSDSIKKMKKHRRIEPAERFYTRSHAT